MKRAVEYKTKAHRLAIQITKDIQGGKFASGVLLPPDSELATDYNVSRLTLRKSLTILSENGQIHRLSHGGALAKTNNPCSSENISNSIGAIPQTERKLSIAFVSAGGIFYSTTQYLNGIERYSEESGLKFTHFLVSHHEEVLEVLSRVKEYEIDGVIVNPYKDERYFSMLNTLVDMNFPIVLQNRFDSLPVSSVMSSDGVGAYRMTHYLIEKYQRPVYYICSSSNSEKTPVRHEGYKNAMKDAGFEEFIESHTCTKEICNNDPAYWV
jgi:DNA-binding transcriptional regulator YhcF (GntR family)